MAWPAISAPSALGEDLNFPQIRTEFESGTVQARPKWTRGRRTFNLSWSGMTEAHFILLQAAFLADQGLSFSWTHPTSAVVYVVRFQGDKVTGEVTTPGRRKVSLVLEEV